jgi:hypothetical protein
MYAAYNPTPCIESEHENRLRKLQASAFGPFDGLTRSDLGRIETLPLRDRVTAYGASFPFRLTPAEVG